MDGVDDVDDVDDVKPKLMFFFMQTSSFYWIVTCFFFGGFKELGEQIDRIESRKKAGNSNV